MKLKNIEMMRSLNIEESKDVVGGHGFFRRGRRHGFRHFFRRFRCGGGDDVVTDPIAVDPIVGVPIAADPIAVNPIVGVPIAADPLTVR